MKHLLNLLKAGLLALFPLLLKAKFAVGAGGLLSVVLPDLGALLGGNTLATLGTVLYWLELLVRTIPTAKDWTPLALVIQLLQAIVPNQATGPNGETGVHEPVSIFRRIFHRPAPQPVAAVVDYAEPDLPNPPAVAPVVSPQLVQAILDKLAATGQPLALTNVPLA